MSPITPRFLLEGAVYALEQCGLSVRDAGRLYRSDSYANAVVLAAYGREALGQWKILLRERQEVIGGKTLSMDKLKDLLDKHIEKQVAGICSITLTGDRDMGVGKLIMSAISAIPGSVEWQNIEASLDQSTNQKRKRLAQDRHNLRNLAMYADPVADGWNRPSTRIFRTDARHYIEELRGDYVGQFERYTNLWLEDEPLVEALKQWSNRPILPPGEEALPL
jgi:AbiV family abortive infection protein